MFEKVKEDRGIRKLNEIGRNLTYETVKLPLAKDIINATKELEKRFEDKKGRVNKSYTKNVIIGLNYAETHFNYKGISLLDNINNDKKIYPNSYY